MKRIALLNVGRLRTPHWQAAAAAYMLRLSRAFQVEQVEVKDGDAAMPPAERMALEGKRLLAALQPNWRPICLDEHGQAMSSTKFAAFLDSFIQNAQTPCFIIGGAYGLDRTVLEKAQHRISLGPMTFPHELAKVLLLEQLYRADSILCNRPYHHA